ncbi:MAG TPA: hypothetical protein VMH38_04345, partial [Thermoplasmata archaeon]|nr:hypothetical protein [Thermoplasmata archaeon]
MQRIADFDQRKRFPLTQAQVERLFKGTRSPLAQLVGKVFRVPCSRRAGATSVHAELSGARYLRIPERCVLGGRVGPK